MMALRLGLGPPAMHPGSGRQKPLRKLDVANAGGLMSGSLTVGEST